MAQETQNPGEIDPTPAATTDGGEAADGAQNPIEGEGAEVEAGQQTTTQPGGEGETPPDPATPGQELPDKVRRRIDRLTSERKDALDKAAAAEARVKELEAKEAEREAESIRGLPVQPGSLDTGEIRELKQAVEESQAAGRDAAFWEKGLSQGLSYRGKDMTAEECREQFRLAIADQAKANARRDAIMDKSRERVARVMKAHAGELLGTGAAPAAPQAKAPAALRRPDPAAKKAAPTGGARPPAQAQGATPDGDAAAPAAYRPPTTAAEAKAFLGGF